MKIGISGIQEVQRENARLMAKFKPGGAFSKLIWKVTISLHRFAVSITHVDTGALRASHRMKMQDDVTGYIWIDKSSVNPKGAVPYKYGVFEEDRGGSHAFYYRTVFEGAPPIVSKATKGFFS